MSVVRKLFFVFLFACSINAFSQEDFYWWTVKHNWDGITPWNQYMTIASAYLGPNALPLPEVKNGRTDSVASLHISFDNFVSRGDKTQDFFLKARLPLFDNRMSVEFDAVPLEWYKMDTITRDIRAVRTKSGKGSAGGDIYLTTTIQIIRDRKFPDVLLRYTLRTASGTHLRDARFTDAPGYYVDLSFGKSYFRASGFLKQVRWYADAGLYAYQTYDLQNLQNDCIYFGGGLTLNSSKLSLSNHLAGYSGYLGKGDRPLVYRTEMRLLQNAIDWAVSYQLGLNDYEYALYRVSCILHFKSDKIFRK